MYFYICDINYSNKMFILFSFLIAAPLGSEASFGQNQLKNEKPTKVWNNEEFNGKTRNHFKHVFNFDNIPEFFNSDLTKLTLERLMELYMNSIKPLEVAYNFNEMKQHVMSDGEIFSLPMVLLLGPWSTGKSTLVNYILGIENSSFALISGAQPTTSDFSILSYSSDPKTVEGKLLVMEKSYSSLEKYGQNFLERLKSYRIPNDVLKLVNFVDTPGVIENRKQQERGYPFTDICRWFIDRSDLIILVFDPAKLDVGTELEQLFKQMKGNEAKVRIVLNKADSITSQELLRVYGSLYWSLSPLINVTEPPKVYVSSFWSKEFHSESREFQNMFIQDEISLLHDIFDVMSNRLQNKIAFLRRHAILVRNHALLIDKYITTLAQHRSFFQSASDISNMIAESPDNYKIYAKVLAHRDVSKNDLFPAIAYKDFFSVHPMDSFNSLSKHCGFMSLCLLDAIEKTIYQDLPTLLEEVESQQSFACSQRQTCKSVSGQ